MKRYLVIAVAVGAAACGSDTPTSPSNTQPTTIVFSSQLAASNEVPAISNADANARGTATITFNVTRDSAQNITGGTATFVYSLNGFPNGSVIRAAHIHEGATGVGSGPVRVDTGLTAASAVTLGDGTASNLTFSGVNMSDAALITAIVANPAGYYFNVHSALNPGGAVRGQLVRQ